MSTVEELHAQIVALSPPDRLRLAADLLEAGRADLAATVARGVVTELGALLMLRDAKERRVKR